MIAATENRLNVAQKSKDVPAEDDFQPMALKDGLFYATLNAFRVRSFDFWYYSSLAGPVSWQLWWFYYQFFAIPIQALAIMVDITTLWQQDYRWFYARYPDPVDWEYFYFVVAT